MSSDKFDPSMIKSIPPELLKKIPGELPPPGVQPNFVDPPTRVPVILGVGSAFLLLALLCYTVRVYTKTFIARHLKWDDLTITLGFLCSIVYYVVTVNGCVNGASGKHQWDQFLDKLLNDATVYQSYITVIMVTPALGLIKISLFLQYYALFKVVRYVKISIVLGASISAVFYITVSIVAFILTSPWPGEDFVETITTPHYLKFAEFSIPIGVIGTVLDCVLLVLPLPAIWQLHLSSKKKLGIALIFMTGGLATAASGVSLYYRIELQNHPSDPTWKVGYVLLWTQVEMFCGVIASSMPTVRQFFARSEAFKSRNTSASVKIQLPSLRKPLQQSSSDKESDKSMDFKQWGYRTNQSCNTDEELLAPESVYHRGSAV